MGALNVLIFFKYEKEKLSDIVEIGEINGIFRPRYRTIV